MCIDQLQEIFIVLCVWKLQMMFMQNINKYSHEIRLFVKEVFRGRIK